MSTKHIWDAYGLTEDGAALADELMPTLLDLLTRMPDAWDVIEYVAREAAFQTHTLPHKPEFYQERWSWKRNVTGGLR